MEKRGQFYLLAAFIIVIVMTGLNQLYSSASVASERRVIYDLAEEASYEAKELFKNMIANNENDDDDIKGEMQKLVNYYSNRYANVDVVVVFGDETNAYVVNSIDIETKSVIDNFVDVIVKGDTKTLEFKQGRRVYVIVRAEKDGEKIFLVK